MPPTTDDLEAADDELWAALLHHDAPARLSTPSPKQARAWAGENARALRRLEQSRDDLFAGGLAQTRLQLVEHDARQCPAITASLAASFIPSPS